MNRINEMLQYSDELIEDRLLIQAEELESTYIETNKTTELSSEFERVLSRLFQNYQKQIQDEDKDKAGFLIILPLLTSIVNGSYEFQFALYSKELYLDETECMEYWCPKQLFEYIDKDMEYLESNLKKKFIRVMKYELEIIRQKLTFSYYALSMLFFTEKISLIETLESFMKTEKEEVFRVLYGEYMNKTITIHTYTKEEV